MVNPFIPKQLVGRKAELAEICQILTQDGDLLIAGVPGSGRRTLIRWAAQAVKARVLEIDCLRATDSRRFLSLFSENLVAAFCDPEELAYIQQWITSHPLTLEGSGRFARLVWHAAPKEDWQIFQVMLALPQALADWLDCRVVIVFQNFTHIRSWDRSSQWEVYLRQEIQRQSRVSYALIATIAEPWVQDSTLRVISLPPLSDQDLQNWLEPVMTNQGLQFDRSTGAMDLFLSYAQGHLGDAIALARRIWLDSQVLFKGEDPASISTIQAHHVHRSALSLTEDLSLTFESLILLLPPSQVRVLESLALDPTDSPHSRDYIQKHQLSRGGGLQGALSSLQQKGLVYGASYGYRIALPMLGFWLRQRLV